MKDDSKVLKEAFEELVAIERIKRLTEEAKTDPRKKLAMLMYKAKRKIDAEAKAKEMEKKLAESNENAPPVDTRLFNPQRQDFVMIYILRK